VTNNFRKSATGLFALAAALLGPAASAQDAQDALSFPENITVFGKNDPNVRRATAVVNGDIITGTDVDQRLALIVAASENKLSPEEIQRVRMQVLRNLIDETLQIQAAKSEDITIDDAEVLFAGALTEEGMPAVTPEQAKGRVVAYSITNNPALQRSVVGRIEAPAGSVGVLFLLPVQARGVLGYVLQGGLAPVDPNAPGDARLFVTDSATMRIFGSGMQMLVPGALGAKVNVKALVDMQSPAFPARNVVAMLPGSDPKLATQYVAIGAHSDHVGTARRAIDHDSVLVFNRVVRPGGAEDDDKMGNAEQFAQINAELAELRKTKPARRDSIFNGADDDGSGSMAVLEIAEAIMAMPVKPKRSTLFVWHTGEEGGLVGSAYYVRHPTVPIDSIVAQLNIDMIGRGRAEDLPGGGDDYLAVIGSIFDSKDLGETVAAVNKRQAKPLALDYKFDEPISWAGYNNIYGRSDHYRYAQQGIPIAFFFTGLHGDYHQRTDEPEWIDYPHYARIANYIKDIAVEVGNGPRPRLNGTKPAKPKVIVP